MFLKISLVILFLLFILFFVPSSLGIDIYITSNNYFLDIRKIKGLKSKITFKLCGIIPVFYKELFEEKSKKKRTKQNESKIKKVFNTDTMYQIFEKSYIDKCVLSLGFNLNDYVASSYVNATLNTILCLYINFNQEKFNLKKLYYQIYIGENLADLSFQGIIKLNLANTIKVIGRQYLELLKDKRQKGEDKILKFKKRRKEYG